MRLKFEKVIPPFDLNIDKFFDLDERIRRNKKLSKTKRDKQQRAFKAVDSINQYNVEPAVNQPAQRMARPRADQKQIINVLNQNESGQQSKPKQNTKNIDQNLLPKQNAESEKVIKAIDEVNKRISKSVEDTSQSSEKIDQEISNLVRKVKQRVKQDEIKDKQVNLSHYYSKLSQSPSRNKLNLNQKQKELIFKDLRRLEKLDKDKKMNCLEKDRFLTLKMIKSDSERDIYNTRYDLTRIKPVNGLENTFTKSFGAIRQIEDLFEEECDEPIYDKPNDLLQINVRPDASLLKISKKCKTIQDLYKVDSDELRQIIEYIEKNDKENGERTSGCSYYMKGNEVYSSKMTKSDSKAIAQFDVPKLNDKISSNQTKDKTNDKIVNQILHDLILNYNLENEKNLKIDKKVKFNSNSCFEPIQSDKKVVQSEKKNMDDLMPNVTKFIESLKN